VFQLTRQPHLELSLLPNYGSSLLDQSMVLLLRVLDGLLDLYPGVRPFVDTD
jgi:hypothetical protein